MPCTFSFAALLNFSFGTFQPEAFQKEALYKLNMIQKHRLTNDTLIFVSSRHLILRYTHELVNWVSLMDQNQPIVYPLWERDLVFVESVAFVRPSSTDARRLHSRSTLFSRSGSLQVQRYGKYFRCEGFFSGFLA